MDGGSCFQGRVDTTWWQPLDKAPEQSAKEILRGSLVDQVVPAECYVAELSTSETDPKTESSVADARDSSAVEEAHEEADSKTEKPLSGPW